MKALIERYKKIRKKQLFKQKFKSNYAFVGVGNHSINNLYPVLSYLNVRLKYIGVKSEGTVQMIEHHFTPSNVTNNLSTILEDKEIKGIFVSTSPTAHFSIAKKVIAADKHLFIEKPPCLTLDELHELIALQKQHQKTVLIGLQRRYAPLFNILSNKVKKAHYYTLKYKTGAYPEGDELIDLFIHPLDILFFLFGEGKVIHAKKIKQGSSVTYLAHLEHKNGIVGSIELSTDYSWNEAIDQLTVATDKGEYVTNNISKLTFTNKPKVVMNIPLEKVKGFNSQTTTLYHQNSFLPVKEHNQLYAAGYFNELYHFLLCVETNDIPKYNKSSLEDLIPTFEAIKKLRSL